MYYLNDICICVYNWSMMSLHNFKTRERGGGETLSDVWDPCEVDLALGGVDMRED